MPVPLPVSGDDETRERFARLILSLMYVLSDYVRSLLCALGERHHNRRGADGARAALQLLYSNAVHEPLARNHSSPRRQMVADITPSDTDAAGSVKFSSFLHDFDHLRDPLREQGLTPDQHVAMVTKVIKGAALDAG